MATPSFGGGTHRATDRRGKPFGRCHYDEHAATISAPLDHGLCVLIRSGDHRFLLTHRVSAGKKMPAVPGALRAGSKDYTQILP